MTTGKEHEDPSVAAYLAWWRRREAAALARDRRLARQARADAVAIAAMLRQRFGASRVVLFGSLARNRFTADSDIDLAVAGLAAEDYYRAIAEASKLSAFPVDLKPLEALTPHFRERVLQTGEDIQSADRNALIHMAPVRFLMQMDLGGKALPETFISRREDLRKRLHLWLDEGRETGFLYAPA